MEVGWVTKLFLAIPDAGSSHIDGLIPWRGKEWKPPLFKRTFIQHKEEIMEKADLEKKCKAQQEQIVNQALEIVQLKTQIKDQNKELLLNKIQRGSLTQEEAITELICTGIHGWDGERDDIEEYFMDIFDKISCGDNDMVDNLTFETNSIRSLIESGMERDIFANSIKEELKSWPENS